MQMTQPEIAGGRDQKGAANADVTADMGLEEAVDSHPEQHSIAGGKGLRLRRLPALPHLGSGGGSRLRRTAAIVNRGLRMQGKKEHQGAERNRQHPAQFLVLHGSKVHGWINPLRQLLYGRRRNR